MIKKVCIFIVSIGLFVGLIFTLSFLYVRGYFDKMIDSLSGNTSQAINSPNPKGMKFISERSFSMKFRSENEIGFGTGWLFAKDESSGSNGLTYYVATNLHVASFIQNANKGYYTYSENSHSYVQGSNTDFKTMEIGQIGSWSGSTFIPGTEKAKLGPESTKYLEYFSLSNNTSASPVSIAYETFDMFKNKQIKNINNNFNDQYVENGTLDLAILKMDFSKVKPTKLFDNPLLQNNSPIKQTLKIFDANPTKFASSFNMKNDVVTVGGFPASQSSNPLSYWNSSSNSSLYTTKKGASAIKSNTKWNEGIHETDITTIKKHYSLPNQISYVTNEYASYLNVAKQNLFHNMDLSGGSSGSMAINQNNEVIGIYWGTYSLSNDVSYGVVDSFKNKLKEEDIVPYDVIENFKSKIPSSSLSKM